MTRGKGIYDDEKQSTDADDKDVERRATDDTPDVNKDADEPTA
ncbi:hypothetical protein [Mycobacterium sp. 236(2023)]|nr:hypothetical protein [Mycobacterium sp. 236(2023)]MDG4665205.1 hypothetical protein [Mycobacterium sp. 236(2023)]